MECPLSYPYCNWYGQLSFSIEKSDHEVRDDTHMTSMKIIQFSRPPTPLVHLPPKFFHPLDLGRPFPNATTSPPLQMITNQWKENIIQGWLLYVIRSFFQVGFRLSSLILHGFPLTSFHLPEASLSAFSWLYTLVCAFVQKYHKLSFIYNCSYF